jgi:hypothetical protein
MRLFHKDNGRIHTVCAKFPIQFLAHDFMVGNLKSIIPTQVSYGESTSETPIFYCVDCQRELAIEELYTKCFKCGEIYVADKMIVHTKTGLVFCTDHSDQYREDKEVVRSLLIQLASISVK